jgi:hypothetical protein
VELVEFLLARIGEDEAEAQGWRTFPWDVQCPCGLEGQLGDYTLSNGKPDSLSITHVVGAIPPPVVGGFVMAGWETQTLTHVLTLEQTMDLWASRELTPSGKRLMVECDAKRRIVEAHRWEEIDYEDGSPLCSTDCEDCWQRPPCHTLRLLALPYADHPDYREEWRP